MLIYTVIFKQSIKGCYVFNIKIKEKESVHILNKKIKYGANFIALR